MAVAGNSDSVTATLDCTHCAMPSARALPNAAVLAVMDAAAADRTVKKLTNDTARTLRTTSEADKRMSRCFSVV